MSKDRHGSGPAMATLPQHALSTESWKSSSRTAMSNTSTCHLSALLLVPTRRSKLRMVLVFNSATSPLKLAGWRYDLRRMRHTHVTYGTSMLTNQGDSVVG